MSSLGFSFLLAVTEVNCFLAFRFFVWDDANKLDFMRFRSQLAWSLVFNEYRGTAESPTTRSAKKKKVDEHRLESAPVNARRWLGTRWDKSCKQDYQQHRCKWPGCKKRTRTYCICSVGHWICQSCFIEHVIEVDGVNIVGD